ncbi:methyltransferase-like protein 23 isoform X1 [Abrus precatorius]|uniref:Methyltransferase-like protein 23 isoform X1 n=1 Tax=Abrus precatorius TaxID=3816 RepID=A0A8B8LV21_ABRPR|nr:methyltransferase-like protein 23 isoform X1 [Abrus precatorius]XP_027360233.1 methyltransferase-like protein 23 isoform X1 [Abrus precatorius]XP_027360234.1 methyltransferase-like protein 23 isoform X1 [Abrus precatorius]
MEEKDWDDEEEHSDDTLTMTTISRHCFGEDSERPSFCISIIENMKEDYGLFVWPCSVVLAEYVWQQKHRFSGATVVELGAGTSLPGLVAAKLGARVTLSDDSTRLEVLDNMRRVCDLNKLECNVLGLTWGVWDSSIFSLQPTIILGADVLYDSNAFDDLFATVTFLLRNSPESIFITSYHNRSGHHLIEFLMVKWGLKCLKLLDGFSFLPSYKASLLSGNIQLAEIALISKDNA